MGKSDIKFLLRMDGELGVAVESESGKRGISKNQVICEVLRLGLMPNFVKVEQGGGRERQAVRRSTVSRADSPGEIPGVERGASAQVPVAGSSPASATNQYPDVAECRRCSGKVARDPKNPKYFKCYVCHRQLDNTEVKWI